MNINYKDTEINKYCDLVFLEIQSKNKRFSVLTFGCQQNEADSEKLRALLIMMGYIPSESEQDADIILINTCAIRDHAEKKVLSLLGRLKALKTSNPDLIIGICGCMAAEEHINELLKKRFPYVSFALEPSSIHRLPELVYYAISGERRFIFESGNTDIIEGLNLVRKSNLKAYVSIMYGCNNFCSYCIVPYVRGRERSRASKDIINECRLLVKCGYKEITLLGQNVNSYKADISFAKLLMEIAEIDGDFIIRFMTSHPKDVSDELIDAIAKYKGKIAPYFHLPVQSGSNRILKAMNRTYTREKYLDTVGRLRRAVSDIAISSDVIVGFPGESEEDFLETLDIIEKVRFDSVFAFIYSKREGTKAATFDGFIDPEIQSERITRLLDIQSQIAREKNLEYIGKKERVLVESLSKRSNEGFFTARTLSNKLVHFKTDKDSVGKFKYVKITDATDQYLLGEEMEG